MSWHMHMAYLRLKKQNLNWYVRVKFSVKGQVRFFFYRKEWRLSQALMFNLVICVILIESIFSFTFYKIRTHTLPCVVVHTFNPKTGTEEALIISEFEASCTVKSCLLKGVRGHGKQAAPVLIDTAWVLGRKRGTRYSAAACPTLLECLTLNYESLLLCLFLKQNNVRIFSGLLDTEF